MSVNAVVGNILPACKLAGWPADWLDGWSFLRVLEYKPQQTSGMNNFLTLCKLMMMMMMMMMSSISLRHRLLSFNTVLTDV
jgi:hypothetical protein